MPDAAGRAAAAAMRAGVAAEGLVVWLDRHPLTLIQAGTVAVRDLRRLAAELDLAEDETALLVDLLVEAGVLGVGGPWEQRSLGLLGLAVAADGQAAEGPATAAWVGGAGADELASAMAGLLPEGSARFLVAGDLTVVAPGGLAPDVEGRLTVLAERETGGGAATWRITEASLRGALDEGLSGDEVLAFLREHSDTPLPQALEYLVEEAARRHGRLRVGAAGTYLRGEAALVTQMVRSAAGRRLGLRELAPGVAVTSRPQRELLAELRKAGEAPVAEEADGSPRRDARRAVRHSPRTALDRLAERRTGPGSEPAADPAEVVARLRATGGPAPAARRAADARSRPVDGAAPDGEAGTAARRAGHP